MKIRLVVLIVAAVGLTELDASAGGAAARQQRNIGFNRKIKVTPPPRWPVQSPEPQQKTKVPTIPQEAPREDATYPPPQTLVSSPLFPDSQRTAESRRGGTTLEENLALMIQRLDQSSEIWMQIPDPRIKMLLVSRYTDLYRRQGVVIQKPALVYANLITAMGQENPAMLSRPFPEILRVVAILEYDFTNGQNKDDLARGILGPQAFAENRKRLGLQ